MPLEDMPIYIYIHVYICVSVKNLLYVVAPASIFSGIMKKKISGKLLGSLSAQPSHLFEPSDLVKWDLTKVAQILTAAANGDENRERGVNSEKALRFVAKTKDGLRRRLANAKSVYNQWMTSTDLLTMPLGSARYIVISAEKTNSGDFGPLLEKAIAVVQHHNEDCPDHCRDLVHCGQQMPDVSVVMLSALDASMSNFARVVVTDFQPIFDAASEDFAGESLASPVISGDCLLPSGHSSSNFSPLIDIYASPKLIAQDENRLVEDMLIDQYALGKPEMYGLDRIKLLSTRSQGLHMSLSFTRVLQHWCVSEHISSQAITRLLKMLHFYKPTITIGDYDAKTGSIPCTGRRLLTTSKRAQVSKGTTGVTSKSVFAEHQITPKIIFGPGFKTKDSVKVGRYVHFGLEKAILGTSIGLLHRYHYRNLLRRIHTVHPRLLPQLFVDLTRPTPEEPFSLPVWLKWLMDTRPVMEKQEPIVFEVRINVDGSQWYESSYIKGTPIFGKLTAIRTLSGSTRVKLPYNLAKPFVIGVFEQTGPKPPARKLMEDTIAEMNLLHPDTLLEGGDREGSSYAVQVTCFDCDAPQRADLKGTKLCSGYYGCERCHTKGVYVPRNNDGPTKIKVPQVTKQIVQVPQINAEGETTIVQKNVWGVRRPMMKNVRQGTKRPSHAAAADRSDINANEETQPETTEEPRKKRRKIQSEVGPSQEDISDEEADSGRDASDEDEHPDVGHDAIPRTVQTNLRAANKKKPRKVVKSGAVRLNQRHNLAVMSKRKQRAIDEDEEYVPSTSDEEQDDDAMDCSAIDNVNAGSTRADITAANGADAGAAPKKKSKRKMEGGATYFPEIGALERCDELWDDYRKPEEAVDVSISNNSN
jgi:hypothetical protein